jgi:hypothetical protein
MEFEGWDNERAIAEVKAMGYDNFDNEMDIRGWLEGYRPGKLQSNTSLDDAVGAVYERRRRLADQIKPGMAAEEVDRLIGDEKTGDAGVFTLATRSLGTHYARLGLTIWWMGGPTGSLVGSIDRDTPDPDATPLNCRPEKRQLLGSPLPPVLTQQSSPPIKIPAPPEMRPSASALAVPDQPPFTTKHATRKPRVGIR